MNTKISSASGKKQTPVASNTVNNHSPSINMPKLSLLALSLCAALSLTGTPSAFAADITSGGGAGGNGAAIGGSGGLGAGGGGGSAAAGGKGATLASNAQTGGNSTGAGGTVSPGRASGGGGGGGTTAAATGGNGGVGGEEPGFIFVSNGPSGGTPGISTTTGGGGGGGGAGLIMTGAAGVTYTNNGSASGGAGGASSSGTDASGGGGGGAALVLVSGNFGKINNTGSVAGGNGGNSATGGNGNGGAGVFLVNGGTLNNQGGTIAGGNAGAGDTVTASAAHTGTGGAGVLSNRGVIENSGTITGGSSATYAGTANSAIVANGGTITNSATGTITGGATTHSGSTTTGGNGVELINDGGATLTNYGTISGGATASATGGGGTGVKVSSNGNTVINAGAINGTGTQDAVTFNGDNNTLQLEANYSFTGNVVSNGANNTLALGGQADDSLDASQISATGQFRGFSTYKKIDESTWTLTGTTEQATDWDVQDGTLHLADAGALNGGSVDLTGGILSAGNGTFTGDVNMTQAEGTINVIEGETATFSGDITGDGTFIKTGSGNLTLNGNNFWAGNTELREGELVLDGTNGGAQLASNIIGQHGTKLKLLNGGSLTGWIIPTDVEIDSTSAWNMTASSQVDNLTNNGLISLAEPTTGDFKTLTVHGNYQGDNGVLVLNTQLGDDGSPTDKLVIEGDTSGTTNVQINNAGGIGADTINGIELITVGGQSDGEFVQSGRIAAGAYDYTLVRGVNNTNNWYLTNNSVDPIDPTDPPGGDGDGDGDDIDPPGGDGDGDDTDPPGDGDNGTERPEAGAYSANQSAANNMFTTHLHSRSGETEYIDALTGEKKVTSLWLRSEGNHNRSRNESGQLKTVANRYVVQMGGNIARLTNNGSDLFQLGVMGGYGNSQNNTISHVTGYSASGKVEGYNVGAYGTWYANGIDKLGLYVDSWAQYSWFNNTVSGEGLNPEKYKSKGVTASVESGYTFKVAENAAGNIKTFIQPKAQAIWMNVKTDDHIEANGTKIAGAGQGNIETRLGVKAFMSGAQANARANTPSFQPFVEMNWVHNSKEFGSTMNGVTVKQAGTRNIAEMKLGVEGQVSRNVNLWGNVAQQVGDKGYNNTSAMLGVKFNF